MGLFDNTTRSTEPKMSKSDELMAKYGLQNVDRQYVYAVKQIASELVGTGMMETGMKLSLAKAEVQLPITYQHVLIEQNWIIIRQLDRLCKLMEQK